MIGSPHFEGHPSFAIASGRRPGHYIDACTLLFFFSRHTNVRNRDSRRDESPVVAHAASSPPEGTVRLRPGRRFVHSVPRAGHYLRQRYVQLMSVAKKVCDVICSARLLPCFWSLKRNDLLICCLCFLLIFCVTGDILHVIDQQDANWWQCYRKTD